MLPTAFPSRDPTTLPPTRVPSPHPTRFPTKSPTTKSPLADHPLPATLKINLGNGWVPYNKPYKTPEAAPLGNICLVSGLVKRYTKMVNPIAILPAGCRPTKRVIFNLNNHKNTVRVDVLPNGRVQFVAGAWQHGWINLDGIVFSTSTLKQNLLGLQGGWHNDGKQYGSATYSRVGSLCEVEGLLRNGDWSSYMLQLPPACRPQKRLIFNLNNQKKTARVDIEANGLIKWHGGGRDHSWLSLGGILFSTLPGDNLKLYYGWQNYGGQYGKLTVTKQGTLCVLSGLVAHGEWGKPVTILPVDCHPDSRLIFNVNNHAKSARVDVLPDGTVVWVAGGHDHAWLSLTGIAFYSPKLSY